MLKIILVSVATIAALGSPGDQEIDSGVADAIAEARSTGLIAGGEVWPGFEETPFPILLLDGTREVLLCSEQEVAGFETIELHLPFECDAASRASVFPAGMLATFPAFNGVSTVVMGTPEVTGLSLERWTVTLLHEHFHQWQNSMPNYYQDVLDLDLHGGDTTGMWMLNYDFPYSDEVVAEAFEDAARAAARALQASDQDLASYVRDYLSRREAFLSLVTDADRRYFEFQLWTEGVARWTELAITREMGETDSDWQRYAHDMELWLIERLVSVDLNSAERVAAYPLGAAEAEMMERLDPAWKESYVSSPFALGPTWAALQAQGRLQ